MLPTSTKLERAIVLELLGKEGEHGCTQAELLDELGATPAELAQALDRLRERGIVSELGPRVGPSRALARLDELGLIAI